MSSLTTAPAPAGSRVFLPFSLELLLSFLLLVCMGGDLDRLSPKGDSCPVIVSPNLVTTTLDFLSDPDLSIESLLEIKGCLVVRDILCFSFMSQLACSSHFIFSSRIWFSMIIFLLASSLVDDWSCLLWDSFNFWVGFFRLFGGLSCFLVPLFDLLSIEVLS